MVSAKGFFTLRQCLFMPVVAQDGQVLFFSYHHIPGEWNNKHLERAWVLLLNKWSLWPQGSGSPGREQLFSVWSHHLLVAILTLDLIVKNIAQTNTVYQERRRSTEVAFMLCYKPSWVQFLAFSIFLIENFDAAEIYRQRHCLERVDSAKSIIVDQSHLVSGKLVLQKNS